MKSKKGFTLIELLAVIVILAIIALIAVPVVMNIITRARKSAAADSAYSVLSAAELYYADLLLTNAETAFTGAVFNWGTPGEDEIAGSSLDTKGTKPTAGKVTLDSNGKAFIGDASEPDGDGNVTYSGALTINGFSCTYSASSTTTITCS